MRLAGQQKAGYFPIPPEAMAFLVKFIAPPSDPAAVRLLDPCCGQGAAIKQLAGALRVPESNVYATEIDLKRGALAAEAMPHANVIPLCDFTTSEVSRECMSAAWVNPPYDDEINGGMREEETFFRRACDAVCIGGLIMLALPEKQIRYNSNLQGAIMRRCKSLSLIRYPKDHRKYGEVVVFAVKRKWTMEDIEKDKKKEWSREIRDVETIGDAKKMEGVYQLPAVDGPPKRFAKGGYTDAEIAYAMLHSPVKASFRAPKPRPQPRPGLQLGAGQRALVLAGGFLNRTLAKDGQTILIKASSYKEQFVKDRTEEEIETKNGWEVKVTTIHSERICLRVRVLTKDGKIHDLK